MNFSRVKSVYPFGTITLQEHQKIVTNVTLSKVSDMLLKWWSMRKLVFPVFQRIKEMCGQNHIMEKY